MAPRRPRPRRGRRPRRPPRPRTRRAPPKVGGPVTVSQFLPNTWLPQKRRQVRATTAYRYAWFVDRYIIPPIGDVPLRRLRADHLDALYDGARHHRRRNGTGLAPKTVLEVHMVIRAALDPAAARAARRPQRRPCTRTVRAARRQRPPHGHGPPGAGHVPHRRPGAAALPRTAPRRPHRDAPRRSRRSQVVRPRRRHTPGCRSTDPAVRRRHDPSSSASRPAPAAAASTSTTAPSTSSSGGAAGSDATGSPRARRLDVLQHRRPVPQPRIPQPALRPHRATQRPATIRFHDLRHTHASLLVAAGTPIKVVSERLGHAHPGFTMNTYQHLCPA